MDDVIRENVVASEIIVDNLRTYGTDVIENKMPNCIDGLSQVQRRILVAIGTNDQLIKCFKVIGNTLTLHPHGDSGVGGALIRMAQPFKQAIPLVTSEGNLGDYSGGEAASPRYLDVTSSEFTRDVYFGHPDTTPYLKRREAEMDVNVQEIINFVPVIPMALLTGIWAPTLGYATSIPMHNLSAVCDLTEKFIEIRKKHPFDFLVRYKDFAQYLVPDYPTYCLIRNEKEIRNNLERGVYDGALITDGLMDIYPDHISIRTIGASPTGSNYGDIVQKLGMELKKSGSFSATNFTDVDDLKCDIEYGDIQCRLRRGVDPFAILSELKKKIGFTTSVKPIWNFTDGSGHRVALNPLTLLEVWYHARHDIIVSEINTENKRLAEKLREYQAKMIIVEHGKEISNLIHSCASEKDAIEALHKKYNVTLWQAKFIHDSRLGLLTHQGRDEIAKALENITKAREEHSRAYEKIDSRIISEVKAVKEKYGKRCPRRTMYGNFIGCISTSTGVIQFSTYEELSKLLKDWSIKNVYVQLYPKLKGRRFYAVTDGKIVNDETLSFPKSFAATSFICSRGAQENTIALRDKHIMRMSGVAPLISNDGTGIVCGSTFVGVTNDRRVNMFLTSDISKRLSSSATGVKTEIIYLSNICADNVVVAYYDLSDPTIVKLTNASTKGNMREIRVSLISKYKIIGIFNPLEAFILNIPEELRQKNTCHYILFEPNTIKGTHVIKLRNRKFDDQTLTPIVKDSLLLTL